MPDIEQIPLSNELLGVMRRAAQKAIELDESFITPRAILLALLDDEGIGPAIAGVVVREKVLAAQAGESTGMARLIEEPMEEGEQPAMIRYDTLAFKTPDGRTSMWLNKDALNMFLEGARRVNGAYAPKHLALGLAAQATHAPGVLCRDPGRTRGFGGRDLQDLDRSAEFYFTRSADVISSKYSNSCGSVIFSSAVCCLRPSPSSPSSRK